MVLTYIAVTYIYAALAASMVVGAVMLGVLATFWFHDRPLLGVFVAGCIGGTVLLGLSVAEAVLL